MDVKVHKIDDKTWCFEEPGVRFFLLVGSRKALLIDSGMETHNAKKIAERTLAEAFSDRQEPLQIELLNTHADPDHCGSNEEFETFYMSKKDQGQYRMRHGDHVCTIHNLEDGMQIDLGERMLEVIALPGHTPGSIAVLDKASGNLFSGDPVQQDSDIFMFGPARNMPVYIESLKKLEGLSESFGKIYPSHGICPLTVEVIGPLIESAKQVLAGELSGEPMEFHGNKISRIDCGKVAFLVYRP